MDDNKKKNLNLKQKERYNNDIHYRKKKQENAKKYYEKKKLGSFEVSFSNEPKILYFK